MVSYTFIFSVMWLMWLIYYQITKFMCLLKIRRYQYMKTQLMKILMDKYIENVNTEV